MYTTIRRYEVPAAQVEEVARRVDNSWLERVRGLPGFISYHVVRSGEAELVSVSAFLDEASGRVATEASAEWVGASLMDLDVKFLETREGPVLVHGGS